MPTPAVMIAARAFAEVNKVCANECILFSLVDRIGSNQLEIQA